MYGILVCDPKAFYMSGEKNPILITQGIYPSRQIHTGLQKRHVKDKKYIYIYTSLVIEEMANEICILYFYLDGYLKKRAL